MFVRNRVFLLLVVGKSGYTLLVLEEWEVKDMCVCFGWMCKSLYDGEDWREGKGLQKKSLNVFFVRRERNSTRFDVQYVFFISILSLLPIHDFSRLVRV